MNIHIFMSLFTLGSCVSSVMTEAIKKALKQAGKGFSTNTVALFDSIFVGGFGSVMAYVLNDIPFTLKNVFCILLMIICVWMASMVGYDKVTQLIEQIGGGNEQ